MNSQSEEDYLKAVYHLEAENLSVSTNSLASYLNMKPSSVSDMLKKLAEKKYINYQKYKGTSLTKKGKLIALKIIRKHRLWESFLVDKLGFSWASVHSIAEQLEHINSEELIDKLDEFLDFPKYDPHGDPIPAKNGSIEKLNQKLLIDFVENETGIIKGVKKATPSLLNYLDDLKINLGDIVKVEKIIDFDRSFIINIKNKKITVSEKICKNLHLEIYDRYN